MYNILEEELEIGRFRVEWIKVSFMSQCPKLQGTVRVGC